MNTAEMWLAAQIDGKVYECTDGDMAYSKEYGLVCKYDFQDPWNLSAWEENGARGIDDLLNYRWAEMKNVMTIEEAEKKLGVIIIR
jgi:hypothetical protein